MAQRKKKSKPQKRTQEPGKAAKALAIAASVAIIAAIGIGAHFIFFAGEPSATLSVAKSTFTPPKITRKAKSLNELLSMSPSQLAEVDIAEMNLLCATGLPGAEKLDIDHCLATLDKWAARVKFETERHLYRLRDPKWAKQYRNSEADFRALFLIQVLQEDLRVEYDISTIGNFAFNDSRVAFLHGMIPAKGKFADETPGGTCTSMPVMYVAVGRRLGYPLKLVITDSHIFVRWDGLGHPNPAWRERFNIEGTNTGMSTHSDDYYKNWPLKTTDYQVRFNRYLVSLTPAEELAQFLAARGHCALDNKRLAFAARCYENAYRYDTTRPCYRAWFMDAAMRSGYRPATRALARLLARRRRPIIDSDSFVYRTNRPGPGAAPPAIPRPGLSQAPAVYWPLQPTMPTVARPHIPQTPRMPQTLQPIRPQHYQSPIPGRPPRSQY